MGTWLQPPLWSCDLGTFAGSVMDWAERVANLRQWSRRGERAPHKPLLLLYALGRFQRYGDQPILYSDAEGELARLLREFGPPRPTTPAYPFHRLATDGVWTVTARNGGASPGDNPGALRREQATGRLAPDLVDNMRTEPQLLPQLAHILLDTNFEPSLHDDICAAVGLDLEEAEAGTAAPAKRERRDPEFRSRVLTAYEHRCAFCGFDGLLDGSFVGLEAAHVRWWTHGGPNEIANGLSLCSIHHKLFDKGVLGIAPGHAIAVSVHFVGRSPAAEQLVLSLTGRKIFRPLKGFAEVSEPHAAWHAREVFRTPARAA